MGFRNVCRSSRRGLRARTCICAAGYFTVLLCFALQTCLSFRTRTHAFKAQSRPWQLTGVSFHSNSRLAEQERMLTPFKVFRVSSTKVSHDESATFCALSTATSLSSLPTLQSPYVDVRSYMFSYIIVTGLVFGC